MQGESIGLGAATADSIHALFTTNSLARARRAAVPQPQRSVDGRRGRHCPRMKSRRTSLGSSSRVVDSIPARSPADISRPNVASAGSTASIHCHRSRSPGSHRCRNESGLSRRCGDKRRAGYCNRRRRSKQDLLEHGSCPLVGHSSQIAHRGAHGSVGAAKEAQRPADGFHPNWGHGVARWSNGVAVAAVALARRAV